MLEQEEKLVSQTLSGDLDGAQLKVKIYTSAHQDHRGRELKFTIEPEETILSLKHRICEEEGTPTMFQRFVFRGHYLEDDSKTMEECDIDNSCQIFVVLPVPVEGVTIKSGVSTVRLLSAGSVLVTCVKSAVIFTQGSCAKAL
jgi:hypothetical protein